MLIESTPVLILKWIIVAFAQPRTTVPATIPAEAPAHLRRLCSCFLWQNICRVVVLDPVLSRSDSGKCYDEVAVPTLAKFSSLGLRAIRKRAAPKRFKPAISKKALL